MFAFIMFSNTFLYDKIKVNFKRKNKRKIALNKAKAFLKPYKQPFGELCLSNQNCTINYSSGKTIFSLSKKADKDGFKSFFLFEQPKNETFTVDEVWDILCAEFDYYTFVDDVQQLCVHYGLRIKTNDVISKESPNTESSNNVDAELKYQQDELLDVNSSSEAELIALPGVTIILAKKIIKHREEKGYFKSVDDFLAALNVKPHFATQIKKLITAKEVEIKVKKRIKLKRILDI